MALAAECEVADCCVLPATSVMVKKSHELFFTSRHGSLDLVLSSELEHALSGQQAISSIMPVLPIAEPVAADEQQ